MPFRHAICNEAFKDWEFRKSCAYIRQAGYDAIEIAPFTLAEDPATLTAEQRREVREIIVSEGLHFAGLHWLMVSPKGLHLTTPDRALRERSWLHVRHLIELAGALDTGGVPGGFRQNVLVFGSPKQRSTEGRFPSADGAARFAEGLQSLADFADHHHVCLLLEALPSAQSDVVTSLGEAVEIVGRIQHPAVKTMFDVHNAIEETDPHAVLVERHFDWIRHVHVNELDGAHCGEGSYDFLPVLRTLRDRSYQGWVSLEAFNFEAGPERIATESREHLRKVEQALG